MQKWLRQPRKEEMFFSAQGFDDEFISTLSDEEENSEWLISNSISIMHRVNNPFN